MSPGLTGVTSGGDSPTPGALETHSWAVPLEIDVTDYDSADGSIVATVVEWLAGLPAIVSSSTGHYVVWYFTGVDGTGTWYLDTNGNQWVATRPTTGPNQAQPTHCPGFWLDSQRALASGEGQVRLTGYSRPLPRPWWRLW